MDISMNSRTTADTIIRIFGVRFMLTVRSVAVDPRLIVIAPTSPIAYKCESVSTSLMKSNTTIGVSVVTMSGMTGTPCLFRRRSDMGNSLSTAIRNCTEIRPFIAVLPAEISNVPSESAMIHPNQGPT